jgi:hypothetical protein
MNSADIQSKPLYLTDFRLSANELGGEQKEESAGQTLYGRLRQTAAPNTI